MAECRTSGGFKVNGHKGAHERASIAIASALRVLGHSTWYQSTVQSKRNVVVCKKAPLACECQRDHAYVLVF